MKYMFLAKRGRPDLETALAFLRTRVLKSTTQDWEKLKRVLEFVRGTINDEMTLGADDIWDISELRRCILRGTQRHEESYRGSNNIWKRDRDAKINETDLEHKEYDGVGDCGDVRLPSRHSVATPVPRTSGVQDKKESIDAR